MKIALLLLLLLPLDAFAVKIQQQGIVSQADCSARGISNSVCLPQDNQIFVTANGLNESLNVAITNGDFAGAANSSQLVGNIGLFPSVSANAMTVNLLTGTGSTPSSGSPVIVNYRSTTNSVGQYFNISTTGALSVVVPSGATLGQLSGVTEYTYVYMQDHLGSNQLCVSSNPAIDPGFIVSSTTISAGATNRGTLYCPAGVTAPVRLIGAVVSSQTVAGLWASAPVAVAVLPFTKGLTVQSAGGLTSSMNIESVSATAACTVSPCSTTVNLTPGISQVTRSGAGNYQVVFTAGAFSTAPNCTCSASRSGSAQVGAVLCSPGAGATTTGYSFITIDASAGSSSDATGWSVICVGQH